jgi:hypothetical protein
VIDDSRTSLHLMISVRSYRLLYLADLQRCRHPTGSVRRQWGWERVEFQTSHLTWLLISQFADQQPDANPSCHVSRRK